MDQLVNAIDRLMNMAERQLAGDPETLRMAKHKLSMIRKGINLPRYATGISRKQCLELSIQFNSSIGAVNNSNLTPYKCVNDAINTLKAVMASVSDKPLKSMQVPVSKPGASSNNSQSNSNSSLSKFGNNISSAQISSPKSNTLPPSRVVHLTMPPLPAVGEESSTQSISDILPPAKKRIRTSLVIKSDSSSNSASETPVSTPTIESVTGSVTDLDAPGPSNGRSAIRNNPDEDPAASSVSSSVLNEVRPRRSVASRKASEESIQKTVAPKNSKKKGLDKKQIEKCENYLLKLSRKITELQGEELSLADLDNENSAYCMVDKLERKFMATMEYLTKKHGHKSVLLGRPTDKILVYESSPYPQVNAEINKVLKKRVFPDWTDIVTCVQVANDAHNLNLSRLEIEEMAKEAFKNIGHHIKKLRRRDFIKNFGSTYTDRANIGNDPAHLDVELNEKLKKQKEEGDKRLQALIERYASLQDDTNRAPEDEQDADIEVEGQSDGSDGDEEDYEEIEEEDEEEPPVTEAEIISPELPELTPDSAPELAEEALPIAMQLETVVEMQDSELDTSTLVIVESETALI